MQKTSLFICLVFIVNIVIAQNTFTNTGTNVGISTTSPSTLLEVHTGIDFGVTGTQFIGPLFIGVDNDFGAGGALQYLLLTPAFLSGTSGLNSAGLNGTLTFYRGSAGSFNFNADYHINIQSAYQNTFANLIPLGENSPILPLYSVTYSSVVYLAIKLSDLLGSSVSINYYGYYWNNLNTVKPQLVLASSLTNIANYKSSASISSNILFGTSSGNIGVGTNNPRAVLDVATNISNGAVGAVLARQAEGNTSGDGTYLGVLAWNTQNSTYNGKGFSIEHHFYGNKNAAINFYRGSASADGFMTFETNSGTEQMRITAAGNIWIGNPNTLTNFTDNYKLNVNGVTRTNKLVVNTTGADFVFDQAYKLTPLNKLEQFVKQNHHLPGIQPAAEMQRAGVEVGEIQAKLLQKIEELTLYIIELKKEAEKQQKEIEILKARVN